MSSKRYTLEFRDEAIRQGRVKPYLHIPEQIDHRFRSKLTTHSAPN
jgi:hypothetical protein